MAENSFIFDFDGTIAETIPLTIDSIVGAYLRLGLEPPTTERIVATFGAKEQGIFKMITPSRSDELFGVYLDVYRSFSRERKIAPFDGIMEVLDFLKSRGAHISLVTGKSDETAAISLSEMGLDGYFKHVECGGMTTSVKTQKICKIIDAESLDRNRVYYIGDSPRDVLDARAAGVRPLVAVWSSIVGREKFASQMPLDIFDTVSDIFSFIKEVMKNRL